MTEQQQKKKKKKKKKEILGLDFRKRRSTTSIFPLRAFIAQSS